MEVKCPYCNRNLNFLVSKDKFLWNARENATVRASRIRNLTIERSILQETQETFYAVVAWINDKESVTMGFFEKTEEAVEFIKKLTKEMMENE